MHFPFAWVIKRGATTWRLIHGQDEARPAEEVPRRAIVPLSGQARIKAGKRFYQTLKDKTRWLRAGDLGIVTPPQEWPAVAAKGEKWIDISIAQQTLVLYEGKRPWYATLISSGRDRYGDPKDSLATPMGEFRLKSKHIAAAMDSEENSTVAGGNKGRKQYLDPEARSTIERLKKAVEAGKQLNDQDRRRWINVEKGRHPEYGVTMRRGSANFELRDVPWIQYFASGYALHGAYWHDDWGKLKSGGCVNVSPIDGKWLYEFTEPSVPEGWHGVRWLPHEGPATLFVVHR
jgi:lipoprotein-anchoring transpeptidase ErfK/SrfK